MIKEKSEFPDGKDNQSLDDRVMMLEQSVDILKSEIITLQKTISNQGAEYFSPDESQIEINNSDFGASELGEKEMALIIAHKIVTQIGASNISDPFVSHLTHIKDKFKNFIVVLNNSKAEIHNQMELLAGEILNVLDLFDDYFWGYSLETNQPMSSGIPDNMKQSAEKIRKLILEFLGLGMINQIEFPAGSDLNPDMQQFVLDDVNPDKNERMIIETLRPGFVKTCAAEDSIVFRKAIVKIR